jgi:hypothetical protein
MKTTSRRNFLLSISVRSIVRDFLAFFRFTEADACTILSAYGLHAFEVDRLKNERLIEQEKTDGIGDGTPSKADRRASPGAMPIQGDDLETEEM